MLDFTRSKLIAACAVILSSFNSPGLKASELAVKKFPDSVLAAFEEKGISKSDFAVHAILLEPYGQKRPYTLGNGAGQLVNPASVTKVFTTGYALEKLGSTYRFKTDFLAASEPVEGVLKGSLYVKGGGDPGFTTADLWLSLRQLKAQGLNRIQGSVVLDDSAFPAQAESVWVGGESEDFDDAPHRAYHAQPNALLMNFGAMALDLIVDGQLVRVVPQEAPQSWAFVSEVKLVSGACGAWKNQLQMEFAKTARNVIVTLRGNYPRSCGQSTLPVRVPNQDWLFESWFREIWAQLGGQLQGDVIKGVTPIQTIALYTHTGKPLGDLIKQVNKWSSNVMARHLELATTGAGQTFNSNMLSWLKSNGIDTPGWVFENGSGLSRLTRIDAQGLTSFLKYMATRADFPDYLASFPRAGADGTLSRRARGVNGYAYLKTGTLNGVRSLGGYLRDKNGQWWAVGILIKSARAQEGWEPMENLLEYLYRAQ